MARHTVGERVGAVISAQDGIVEFLGYGVFQGYEVPPEETGGFNLGIPNPKILLDNGDVVWGCECWWSKEADMKKALATAKEIKDVRIADIRERAKSA